MKKWIPIRRQLPPIDQKSNPDKDEMGGYLSEMVKVITLDGEQYNANLWIFGNPIDKNLRVHYNAHIEH